MRAPEIRNASITTDMFNYSFKPAVEAKLKLFHDHGFRYIHWCDDWRNEDLYTKDAMEEHQRVIESCGLKCIDVHSAETQAIYICAEEDECLERYIRLLENRVEFCSLLGGDALVIHPPGGEKGSRPLSWKLERTLQVFDSLRPLCERLGVILAVENCYPTDEKVLEFYFKKYPPEFVGLCLDSGHANVNKNLHAVLGFGDRMRAMHLHDNRGLTDDHQPPFWGTVEWAELMPWIAQSGYPKPINFEITHRPGLFDGSMEDYMAFATRSIQRTMALVGH